MYLLQAKGVPKLAGAAPKRLNVRSFLFIQFGLVCRQVYAGIENKESQKERRDKRENVCCELLSKICLYGCVRACMHTDFES
jgi:hypothetical protein